MAAGQPERLGVRIAGVGELRLALEHQEPRPPVDVRYQYRTPWIPQQVPELRPGLRNGDAHATVPRVHGDDAELRHAVPPERGEDALRIVVEELLDLRGQRIRCRHGSAPSGRCRRVDGSAGILSRRSRSGVGQEYADADIR